jgi:chemotaxis protein MotA
VASSPATACFKAIKATLAALPTRCSRARTYNKALYMDLLAMLFEILAKVRKEGLMSIEGDIENPDAARSSPSTRSRSMTTT